MTLQQLKYLIEVADKGSINKAARSLYISQPSLSNAIKDIENEIQINIFNRTSKGITVTLEGAEFLVYAREIVRQAQLLEEKYKGKKPSKLEFSVSTQHCAFTVLTFCQLIKKYGNDSYEFNLKEGKPFDVIDDVKNYRSAVGIIYVNEFNENAVKRKINEANLEFEELFTAKPHILVSSNHALTKKKRVKLKDLEEYPCLSFEQDEYNLFYFSEEILSSLLHKKSIKVSERATLFTVMTELNGFTVSTGIISQRLKKQGIVPIDLEIDNLVKIGTVVNRNSKLSKVGKSFIEELRSCLYSMS
ncbi:MAG: LysR family transcriptional regulator [Tissierellia bacterium]|nr:LysR family transcriptional regulator [Tissierellia bacterium]